MVSSQLRDFNALNPNTGKFDTVTEYPEFAWQEGEASGSKLTH